MASNREQICELTLECFNEVCLIMDEQFGIDGWTKEQIKDAFNNKAVKVLGTFIGTELACIAFILISLDDINLLEIATKEKYKRQGLAKAMLNHIFNMTKQGQSFSLEVKSQNQNAINLYTNFGFKTLHVRKKYYQDGDDAFCMFMYKN